MKKKIHSIAYSHAFILLANQRITISNIEWTQQKGTLPIERFCSSLCVVLFFFCCCTVVQFDFHCVYNRKFIINLHVFRRCCCSFFFSSLSISTTGIGCRHTSKECVNTVHCFDKDTKVYSHFCRFTNTTPSTDHSKIPLYQSQSRQKY